MTPSQYKVACEFGFKEDLIRKFIYKPYKEASDLIDELEEAELLALNEETGEVDADKCVRPLSSLREETERLYYSSVCLICHKQTRSRVNLPCSHLSHCEHCDKFVKHCPVRDCCEAVEVTIQTFM